MTDVMWRPKLGDLVWFNFPDVDKPEGRVVGFVAEGYPRAGQPIIERIEDEEPGRFGTYKKGEQVVMHPAFLLPFAYGSEEYRKAEQEGRIGGG